MAIYNGTQKVSMSGIDKVYVGTQLVYQNTPPVLESITLSGQTTSRNRGQSFVFGGTVTAHYSNSSTANVTSQTTFSGYNMNTAGTYTVTAKYTENGVTKTATYQLTVNKIWTTVFSGTKQINAASSVPADWDAGLVKQSKYKLRITCVLYLKAYDSSTKPHYWMLKYNPSGTLASGQSTSYTYENTIASTAYTTNEVSASANSINFFGLYGRTTSTQPSVSDTTQVTVKLVFGLKTSSTAPKLGLSYTLKNSYNDAYIKITKVEQYY